MIKKKKPHKEKLDLVHVLGICRYKELVFFYSGSAMCNAKTFAVRKKMLEYIDFTDRESPRNLSLLCLYISEA